MPTADRNDKDGCKMRAWRKIGIEGKPGTYLEIFKKQTFPHISPEKMWEWSGPIKNRLAWDKRMIDPKFINYSESPF